MTALRFQGGGGGWAGGSSDIPGLPSGSGFLVFLKLVILMSALPYLPVEQAEQVFTAAVCHSHQANNSAKHTVLCGRPNHYTRREFLSYGSNVISRLPPKLCLWLKDLGHAMFQRNHGGQRGVAEENRGKSV